MKKQKDRGVPVKGPIVTEIFPVRDNKDVDEEDNDDDDDESKGDRAPSSVSGIQMIQNSLLPGLRKFFGDDGDDGDDDDVVTLLDFRSG